MTRIEIIVVVGVAVALATGSALAQRPARSEDVAGGRDAPYLTRMPGAVIEFHDHFAFAAYTLPVGPLRHVEATGGKEFADIVELTGEVTRVQYSLPADLNARFVYENYRQALADGGYTILFAGAGRDELGFGGDEWWFHLYGDEGLNPLGDHAIAPRGEHPCYVAARKQIAGHAVHVVVYVFDDHEDLDFTLATIDVIESRPVATGLVTVDELAADLRAHGHVAVHGILFDTDAAVVKAASSDALGRVARLLADRPDLDLYVVGHTDDVGGFQHNLDLSRARANAVVDALVENHGVDRDRLQPHGVGPLVPVASNDTEAGRRQNRRVELVSRLDRGAAP